MALTGLKHVTASPQSSSFCRFCEIVDIGGNISMEMSRWIFKNKINSELKMEKDEMFKLDYTFIYMFIHLFETVFRDSVVCIKDDYNNWIC